jgi:hypothetical protein
VHITVTYLTPGVLWMPQSIAVEVCLTDCRHVRNRRGLGSPAVRLQCCGPA